MRDAATYRRFAEECQRLAMTMSEEHRAALLEIADAWIKLEQEAEREKSLLPPSERKPN
jgi:hypothetical protein